MQLLGLEDEIDDVPVEHEGESERFEIWPENVKTLELFLCLDTQWFTVAVEGFLIRTGIRYEALPFVLSVRRDIARKDWQDIFNGIRIMEVEALKVSREMRERQQT